MKASGANNKNFADSEEEEEEEYDDEEEVKASNHFDAGKGQSSGNPLLSKVSGALLSKAFLPQPADVK